MNPTSNELLNKILGACVAINNTLKAQGAPQQGTAQQDAGSEKTKNTGIGIMDEIIGAGVNGAKALKTGATVIKEVLNSLIDFNKAKIDTKRIDATSRAIRGLFETIMWVGSKQNLMKSALNSLNSLATNLKGISEFAKTMSMFFLSIGGSILLTAVSLWAAGQILGTSPLGSVMVMTAIVIGMAGLMFLLGKANKLIEPGMNTVKGMGLSMMYLAGGILGFIVAMKIVSVLMGTEDNGVGILKGVGMVALIIAGTVGMFALIGLAAPYITPGLAVINGMALGMLVLAGGILALTLVGMLVTKMAKATSSPEDSKGVFGAYGPMVKGLGIMGIVLLGAVGLFSLLGVAAPVIIPGVVAGVAVGLGLIMLAFSVKKMMDLVNKVDIKAIGPNISAMLGGVMTGIIDGVGTALSGGKKGIAALATGLKNSYLLMTGITMLMGVSVALSMFAYALTAFVNLGNMRVIEGYDKDTGKPKFGPTVDVRGVGQTVSATISNFLEGLIQSTSGLMLSQARAIKKMARALTGERGILSSVIQFAKILEIFAKFGPNGEIGYVEMVPDGKDEDGNVKYKKITSKVKITTVTKNITDSYTQFVTAITRDADKFGITGEQGKKMMNLGAALMGTDAFHAFGTTWGKPQPGLLTPVKMFADTLMIFAKFGEKNEIAILDENGKPTGQGVPVAAIAGNIINMLITFADTIANDKRSTTSIDAAVKKLSTFDVLIKKLSEIGSALDPLSKLTTNIGMLADNFERLAASVTTLDVDKVGRVANVANTSIAANPNSSMAKGSSMMSTQNNMSSTTINDNRTTVTAAQQQSNQPNWEAVADKMAMAMAAKMAESLKSMMFHFEFAGKNEGVLEVK